MSRKNLRLNLVAILTSLALLLAALGCESGSLMGPTPDSSLSTPSGPSLTQSESVNG